MSLEATHIRFALDLKNKFNVLNIGSYISGTIYPDSRYVSGIDRNLTHPNDLIPEFLNSTNDFKKGWAVHLLCDKIHRNVAKTAIPQIFSMVNAQDDNVWINHTALKILQDIDDVSEFEIIKYLPFLDYTETPNNEEPKQPKKYNQIFQKMYADPAQLSIESYFQMWMALGISEELATKVKVATEEYNQDKTILNLVKNFYQESLAQGLSYPF